MNQDQRRALAAGVRIINRRAIRFDHRHGATLAPSVAAYSNARREIVYNHTTWVES
jgi:hypothetical protein